MFKRLLSSVLSVTMIASALVCTPQASIVATNDITLTENIQTVKQIAAASGTTTLIQKGAQWSYKRDTQGDNWLTTDFSTDNEWVSAPTPIGYGYSSANHPLATDIGKGSGSLHIYLQKTFELDTLDNINSVYLNICADDSATVYLNGKALYNKEISPDVDKDVTAIYPDNSRGGCSGDVLLPASLLKEGTNLVSVDVKNTNITSSDIYFDMAFGVSTDEPNTEAINFYQNVILTPGEDEDKLNVAWYSVLDGTIGNYFVDAPYNSTYCIEKGSDGGTFYFNDNNKKSVYRLPLDTENAVDGIVAVDVAANYTVETSVDGTNYTQRAVAPNGAGVGEMDKSNRTVLTYKLSELGATNSEYVWVRIGDQTTGNGWGGCIYNLKVSYTDTNGDNIGDLVDSVTDARVQIVKKSELVEGEMPESTEDNTYYGKTSNAVSGYASNKVTVPVEADTEYAYRIGQVNENEWSKIFYTTTQNSEEYEFIYIGDPQLGAGSLNTDTEKWIDTMQKAQQTVPNAAFIVSAGDQVNTGSNEGEYNSLTKPEQLQQTPFVPTIGNHDANDINYTYHYNMPNVTGKGKTGAGSDYYYFYGETLFVDLNGNNNNVAEHKQAIEQAIADYKAENNNNEPKWKIAVMHQDIYGSGKQHSMKVSMVNLRKGLYPIFDQFDFDVVLTGHDHTYTRSYIMKNNVADTDAVTGANGQYVNADGTLYMTANSSSGSKYYPLCPVQGTYVATRSQYNVPSYAKISITDNTFELKTYRTDTNEVYDECAIAKNATNEDVTAAFDKAMAVENKSAELLSAIRFVNENANTDSPEVLTEALTKLVTNMPSSGLGTEAEMKSIKIAGVEGTITETTTFGEKQPDGSYKNDGETIDLTDTVAVEGAVRVKVPYSTDLKNVTPEITVSKGATYTLNKTDFSGAVTCNVVSENGSVSHKYTIIVTKNPMRNGFVVDADNVERYYVNDILKKDLELNLGGSYYYVDENGAKVKNKIYKGYYYGADGARVYYKFVNWNSNKYYLDSVGAVATGVFEVNGDTYYADSQGRIVTGGLKTIGGKKYYFSSTGVMTKSTIATIGSAKYYFDSNGVMKTNSIVSVGGKKYALSTDGKVLTGGFVTVKGSKYYAASNGQLTTNSAKKIKGKYYVFNKAGVMQKGNKIVTVKNAKYYVDKKGVAKTKALVTYKSKKYYVGKDAKAIKNKLQKIKKKLYYFGKDCAMVKNKKVKVGKITYKFNKKGIGKKV